MLLLRIRSNLMFCCQDSRCDENSYINSNKASQPTGGKRRKTQVSAHNLSIMSSKRAMLLLFMLGEEPALTRSFMPLSMTTRNGRTRLSDAIQSDQGIASIKEAYMPWGIMPPKRNWNANSTQRMCRLDIQKASNTIKRFVESRLETDLHLTKHTTPLAFLSGTGVNDDLDGSESKSPVKFAVPNNNIPRGVLQTKEMKKQVSPYNMECEIVQSLAKWKRVMLKRLEIPVEEGIFCESTSIRKGYKGDVTHSVIADQWDFEIRISEEQRTVEQLKIYVEILYRIVKDAELMILDKYPQILPSFTHPSAEWRLPDDITFVTSQELHEEFPGLDVHERENAAVDRYGAVFILGMGWPMKDGSSAEEIRSPSYDDWSLNGDIIVRHPLTEYRHELSSMGIRVDGPALLKQLQHRGFDDEVNLSFQQAVVANELPLSYGGGLGISRLLMLLLRTAHIGEVQCGVWHDAHYAQAESAGVDLIPDRIMNSSTKNGLSP